MRNIGFRENREICEPEPVRRRILSLSLAFVLASVMAPMLSAPANAVLCATDEVPAGTLLFPFLTASFAAESTPANPVADRSRPMSLFSITNVSSTPRIVHFVLSNDMGTPLLGWDALFNGYQTISLDFADIVEGKLRSTGGTFSPTPTTVPAKAWGPIGTFYSGVPKLPFAKSVGKSRGSTDSIYGLCTNPDATPGLVLPPDQLGAVLPEYLRAAIFLGLRKSATIAENG